MAESRRDETMGARLRHVLGSRGFAFLIAAAIAFLITFARNPSPYFERVLLTEDGNPYYNMLQIQGFWPTVTGARDDYYVFGNVALAWVAIRGCDWLAGGDPFVVPAYVAVVSYLFFGVVAALPTLTLRGRVPLGWLIVLTILLAFLPLSNEDNEILGRISNTGFSWLTIAFLAAIRRDDLVRQPTRNRWDRGELTLIDLSLAVSIATNPNAVLLLPFVVLPYLRRPVGGRLGLLRQPGLIGALAVVLGSLPTVYRVVFRDRPIPGPTTIAPLTVDVVAELAGARALLYPVVNAFYQQLGTVSVVALIAVGVGLFLAFGRSRNRRAYLLGAFVLVASSLALVALRPELYRCCRGFQDTYPLRYVRAQNEIVACLLVLLAWDVSSRTELPRLIRRLAPLVLLAGVLADVGGQSSFQTPGFRYDDLGGLGEQVVTAIADRQFCDREARIDPDGGWLRVRTYPIVRGEPDSTVLIPRELAESAVWKRSDREQFAPALVEIQRSRGETDAGPLRTAQGDRIVR